MASWDDFREAVSTRGSAGRPATQDDLDAYEARHGVRLPSRYREFAATYGAGRLYYQTGGKTRYLDFSVPGRPTVGGGRTYNIDILNSDLRKAEKATETRPGGRMVFFARIESPTTGNAQALYGWNLDEVTDAETHDYAIYEKRPKQKGMKKVASTFEEFILDYCVKKPLAAWLRAGHPSDAEIPQGEEPDETSRIRYAQDHIDRIPGARARKVAEPRAGAVHRLAAAPERFGPGGEGIRYRELLPDGEVVEREWLPDGDDDRERLEGFWRACQRIAWKDGEAHDVASPPFRTWGTPAASAAPSRLRVGAAGKSAAPETTETGLIRRVPHDPAPVSDSWRRIEAWMSAHCPEVVAALRPGLPEKAFAAVEKVLGVPLPEDVKASYRVHDGIGRIPDEYLEKVELEGGAARPGFVSGVFYSLGLDRLDYSRKGPTSWADVEEEPDQDADHQVFPADAIRHPSGMLGLVPLYEDEGGDLGLGIDLDPGPNGVVGQVINFDRFGSPLQFVLARSWGQFLEDYADELEAGNYEFRQEPGGRGRDLFMKRPEVGPFQKHWRAWSEAKLDPDFLAARPVPAPMPVPADPETDRACRATVEGFLAEHHAWEVRWQAVRPVARLGFESIGERENGEFTGGAVYPNPLVEEGLPVPEGIRFFGSHAWGDQVKRMAFLRTHLKFGQYHATAMAEQRQIYAKYTTAWRQRKLGDTFWLRSTVQCDPAFQRPISVLRRDATTAYVYLDSLGDDRIFRYKLKREDGVWRIERMQTSDDGKPFQTRLIDVLPHP